MRHCLLAFCSTLPLSCCTQEGVSVSLPAVAKRTDKVPLDFAGADALSLESKFGTIEVKTGEDVAPMLTATLTLHARTDDEAKQLLERFRVEAAHDGRTLSAALKGEPVKLEVNGGEVTIRPTVDYAAVIPRGMQLVVRAGSGAIAATGPFSACDLDSGFGKVTLERCDGDARLHSRSGDLRASSVKGSLRAETDFGAIALADVQGKSLAARTRSGKVELERCRADAIDASSDFGELSLLDCSGKARVETRSGAISVRGLDGSIDARSGFGKVDIAGKLGELAALSRSGDVQATVTELLPGAPAGWDLRSDFGKVVLAVPSGFGCQLDASTQFGKVECGFDIAVAAGKHAKESLSGTIGKGGGRVTLATRSGDVALRKQ